MPETANTVLLIGWVQIQKFTSHHFLAQKNVLGALDHQKQRLSHVEKVKENRFKCHYMGYFKAIFPRRKIGVLAHC